MRDQYFEGELFERISLSEEVIQGCEFVDCRFVNCSFEKCRVIQCGFPECRFEACRAADLRRSDFRQASGYKVDIMSCQVRGAKFSYPEAIHLLPYLGRLGV